MLIPANMTGKTIGVLGLGRSGLAAVEALVAAGAHVLLADDHHVPDTIPVPAQLVEWAKWPWAQLDLMVISPGIPHDHPAPHRAAALATQHDVMIVSEIEIAMRAPLAARVVGITGTNGKSTTCALIGHCLKSAGVPVEVGGNIGDAACHLTDPGAHGVIVLELSSYQLETTPSLRLDAGAILNITPDHLDRHGGMDGYVAAKAKLATAISAKGLAVFGAGGDEVRALAAAMPADGCDVQIIDMAPRADAPENQPPEIRAAIGACPALAGPHNAENAVAAMLILRHLGLADDAIAAGIASFAGLAHRMQPVATAGSVNFVNDSKATNGVAAAKALMAFDNIYWIAGGMAKQDGLGAAGTALRNVTGAYLIGSSAAAFAATLAGKCPTSQHENIQAATTAAFADAWTGGAPATVLLAPAAASFDQFDNFAARGDAFVTIAQQLAASVRGQASPNGQTSRNGQASTNNQPGANGQSGGGYA
jgi:UDP-N-acetylmuramoylalanine--D-glutamate ligase